ncbi:MAG: response regulator [Candidatus Methanoperedens sp.]|nr:response regulator [Candidatus Methanoperedens sp.]
MTKVLVVEDSPFNMELVLEVLDDMGFIAAGVTNGADAIKNTENEVYDLILMDIELPGMDGVVIQKILKNNIKYKNIPIIALTAYAMKGDKERFIAEGFDDYISKPINMDDFTHRLEKYRK